MKGLFVIGTDTGVGKTLVCSLLMAAASPQVRYWKPVQTGEDDDTATVRALARQPAQRCVGEGVRLTLAASPHHAAEVQGLELTLEPLLALAARHAAPGARFVVEGAGGLCVPLSRTLLQTDLVKRLGLPVLLVASTRLGTINHTLLTLRELERQQIPTLGIVLSGASDPAVRSGIAAHGLVPIVASIPDLAGELGEPGDDELVAGLLRGTPGEGTWTPKERPAVAFWGRILLQVPAIRAALM